MLNELKKNKNKTHGMKGTSTYNIWNGMIGRCFAKGASGYKRYGGRGIVVCDRWLKFENFLEDMGIRPDGMQLDRIDNEGNYERSNCKWVTPKENNRYNKGDADPEHLTGKFNKWTVLYPFNSVRGQWRSWCRCDCGFEAAIQNRNLKKGLSHSCRACQHKAHRGWNERKKCQTSVI